MVGAPPARRAAGRDPGVGVRAACRVLLRLRPVRRPRGVLDRRARVRLRPGPLRPVPTALRHLAVQRCGVQALRRLRVRLFRPHGPDVGFARRGRLRDPRPLGLRAPPGVRRRAHDRRGAVRGPPGHPARQRRDPRLARRPGARGPGRPRRAAAAAAGPPGAPPAAPLLLGSLRRSLPPPPPPPPPSRTLAAPPPAPSPPPPPPLL